MPENVRLYMDQMFQTHVAIVLRRTGYDIVRASEVGQSRADDRQILKKAINDNRILKPMNPSRNADAHAKNFAISFVPAD